VAGQNDVATISEVDLRYKYFGVTLELVVEEVEIIRKNGFATLVDMALCVLGAVRSISAGEDAELGFTESAEIIHLRRDDDLVVVSSSNRPVKGSVAREELLSEFIRFLRVAYHRLVTEVPGLSENPIIRRFSPDEVFRS
jgi:hypothetical protein